MPLAGIIAEFNPLHNGHKYLIDNAKKDGFDVACVISGNFVQRGDTAIIPKFKRAKMALSVGADIVCELPVPWSMSTAQNFALGGISQLAAIGIDSLYFGSECGDITELLKVSDILLSEGFDTTIKNRISSGETYAKIRTKIVNEILGYESSILSNPNDTLATEYICAAKKLCLNIEFHPVKRIGAGHNASEECNGYSTATLIRNAILNSDNDYLLKHVPAEVIDLLQSSPISNIRNIDCAIIAKLKQLKQNDFSLLPDISEGLDNLIYKALRSNFTFEELCDDIKSKRYTHARIRRVLLSCFLGIDDSYFKKEPPYLRVLGFSKNGSKYLNGNYKPIITLVSQIAYLDDFAKKVFDLENTINELYALSLNEPCKFVNEQAEPLIKTI